MLEGGYWGGCRWFIPAALVVAGLAAAAQAGAVRPMMLAETADLAGQVIVGEVASVRSYWAENPRRIESEVTFKGVEYLKGALADSTSTFSLIVPGGQVGEWQMRISCAPTFAAGEKWVLFLLPSYKTFPVVGLHQGAFRVETDAEGVARVYDASGQPITGLGADGFVRSADREGVVPHDQHERSGRDGMTAERASFSAKRKGLSTKEAGLVSTDRVRVQFVGPALPVPQAMTYDEFIAAIRPTLEQSKAYSLTTPAGRPELPAYFATPIRKAPAGAAVDRGGSGSTTGEANIRGREHGVRKADAPPRRGEPRADKAVPTSAEAKR
jgi:hypothetical protein